MILTILGNNGPYPSERGATSGYLIETSGKKFVLDFGSGVFSNLIKVAKPEELSAIFISHLHFDHTSDLGVLAYYFQLARARGVDKKVDLYFPEKTPFTCEIESLNQFNVFYYGEQTLFYGDVAFTFTQVRHPVKTFALMVESENKKFFYTADSNFCDNIEKGFAVCEVALCDGGFISGDWADTKPHMSVKGICELAKKHSVKAIITHLNPKYSLLDLDGDAFGDYTIAEIGKTYTI